MKGIKRKLTDRELEDEIYRIENFDIKSDQSNSDCEKYEEPLNNSGSSVHFSGESDSDESGAFQILYSEVEKSTRDPVE